MKLSQLTLGLILVLTIAPGAHAEPTSKDNQRLKKALKQHPEADLDGDGVLTMSEARKYKQQMQKKGNGNQNGNTRGKAPGKYPVKPTLADVKYGEYDRNILDFWKADVKKPAPLLVYIHGGGFTSGSKEKLAGRGIIEKALKDGMHVASINYRYQCNTPKDLKDPQRTGMPGCFLDGARAIQFMKHKAKEWNVDKDKIIVFGSSAGGGIALFIAFYDDLADPKSKDPVLRESSRVLGIGHMYSQPTYNIERWPEILGFTEKEMGGIVRKDKASRPLHIKLGLKSESDLDTPLGKKYASMIDITEHADADDPAVFIFNAGKDGKPTHHGQIVHHPRLSIYLDTVCKKNGIKSELARSSKDRGTTELLAWCQRLLENK